MDDLAGLQGDKSGMRKLLQWLIDWPKHHCGPSAKNTKKAKPGNGPGGDGSAYKAVLLSGPPGIGKTTCAVLCCQKLNLAYREMNASEARNKKSIEGLEMGAEHIERFLQPKGDSGGKPKSRLKGVEHVLIMDEVDGMSGNADRQGVSSEYCVRLLNSTDGKRIKEDARV
jgi:replication factor C subunit 1